MENLQIMEVESHNSWLFMAQTHKIHTALDMKNKNKTKH